MAALRVNCMTMRVSVWLGRWWQVQGHMFPVRGRLRQSLDGTTREEGSRKSEGVRERLPVGCRRMMPCRAGLWGAG